MSTPTEDLQARLVAIMGAKEGTPTSLVALSKRLAIGTPALSSVLQDMGPTHNVRSQQSGRHLSYLIPTPDMLRQERETQDRATRNTFHPLRRRSDHAEALARARASHLDLVKE